MHPSIDIKLIYQLSCKVINGSEFNVVLKNTDSPKQFHERRWFGKVWADLTNYVPFSAMKRLPDDISPSVAFEHSIERSLQIIFTRFATREFSEGLFLLKAEMGQDWFTPILQQPHCILRHMNYSYTQRIQNSSSYYSGPHDVPPSNEEAHYLQDEFLSQIPMRKRSATISTSSPSNFETYTIFYLGHNVKEFCSNFYPIGLIPGINSWSAVMTVDPIMDSEESSFEIDDQTFSIPQGKHITLDQMKSPMLSMAQDSDNFVDSHMLDMNPELNALSLRYF